MRNTSILNRIIGLALSLALLVSMMPMLASEVHAEGTVSVLKWDRIHSNYVEATFGEDYTITGNRYDLNSDDLKVTTDGVTADAVFGLSEGVKTVTFENVKSSCSQGYSIQGDEELNDQTIYIAGDCSFTNNIIGVAMLFQSQNGHEVTFSSRDKNSSLSINSKHKAIEVEGGNLNFRGHLNATIVADEVQAIRTDKDIIFDDNVKVSVKTIKNDREDISTAGNLIIQGNAKVYATLGWGTAVHAEKNIDVLENASIKVDGSGWTKVVAGDTITFDTTGTVEVTNTDGDDSAIRCEILKALNREGKVILRSKAVVKSPIQLGHPENLKMGYKVHMFGNPTHNVQVDSVKTEISAGSQWMKEDNPYLNTYHPYVGDKIAQVIVIRGITEAEEIASADAARQREIAELEKKHNDLVNSLMKKKVKITKLKSYSKKKVALKIDKHAIAQTYEIKYKTSGKSWKTITTTKLSRTFTKLKRHKRFYVKVRGIYKSGTTKKFTPWCTTKSVKVK